MSCRHNQKNYCRVCDGGEREDLICPCTDQKCKMEEMHRGQVEDAESSKYDTLSKIQDPEPFKPNTNVFDYADAERRIMDSLDQTMEKARERGDAQMKRLMKASTPPDPHGVSDATLARSVFSLTNNFIGKRLTEAQFEYIIDEVRAYVRGL